MATGYRGTYVIAWSQVSVEYDPGDGAEIAIGFSFRWTGQAVRMDGPPAVLALGAAEGQARLHARARRVARRIIPSPVAEEPLPGEARGDAHPPNSFVVTDGRRRYPILLAGADAGAGPLLLCEDGVPPAGELLRVVQVTGPGERMRGDDAPFAAGRITGIAEGALIRTPGGLRRVETLAAGDPVSTRDGAERPLRWVGRQRISGARMLALPQVRPVCIRAGALGAGLPARDLRLAPDHRLLLRGPQAEALFGTPEVLIAARDLIDDQGVGVARGLRETCYVHLLFDGPQLIWADGAGCESLDAADAEPGLFDAAGRAALGHLQPGLAGSAPPPRRVLAAWEAAVLRHGLRPAH